MSKINILCLGAHHDDIELGCGGSALRWSQQGNNVYSLVLTESTFTNPDGKVVRNLSDVNKESSLAAEILGIRTVECPEPVKVFELRNNEQIRCQILNVIKQYDIDTLLFPWDGDPHKDHSELGQASLMCGKSLPRLLMYKIEFHCGSRPFNPSIYVDISDCFEKKLEALKVYRSEFERSGVKWEKWLRNKNRTDGIRMGVEYAEAFQAVRYLLP
ncbi:MAG TPA: hypothetical protein ENH82_10180 [bacterium]|nr:hypothetical protein [bacterium]